MKKETMILIASIFLSILLVACENEGSAEKAGKEIDKTITEAGKEFDKAITKTEKEVNDAIETVNEKIEETQEKKN